MKGPIEYQIENDLTSQEFIDLLRACTLGDRRPVDDEQRIKSMLSYANLIVTARHNGHLVGVARSLTDFAFCTYLSDLAVDESYQKMGIGVELIRITKLETPASKLILLAAPDAIGYYPKIGMKKHENCFYLDDIQDLT